MILWNYMRALALAHPEREFMVNGDRGLNTYGAAAGLISALAGRLTRDSERRRSVGVVIRDSRLLFAFIQAAGVAGRLIHIFHPLNTAEVLLQLAKNAECDTWYVEEGILDFVFEPSDATTTVVKSPDRGSVDDSWEALGLSASMPSELPAALLPWDAAHTVLYTSGTTGLPKGVVLPYRYGAFWGEVMARELGLGAADSLYCSMPLYHNMGLNFTCAAAVVAGCPVFVRHRFSASQFWDEIEASRATGFPYLGAMLGILQSLGPPSRKVGARLRFGYGGGATDQARAFFKGDLGVDLLELYGMTEIGCPMVTAAKDGTKDSIGPLLAEYDVEIQDEQGLEVADNEVGEIVARPRRPGMSMKGYWNDPKSSWAATRNFWWRTGDLGRRDPTGWYHFEGRSKDVIRRRGENVPAIWVENALASLAEVVQCAAIAVPSPLGEEEIKVFVVHCGGDDSAELAQAMLDHCLRALPAFAVPDELEFVRDLPKTPTQKILKAELRQRRTLGGYVVRRETERRTPR